MKIAFLSSLNPEHPQSWSGTLRHMLLALRVHNEVTWVGGALVREKQQMHRLSQEDMPFIPELYVDYWAAALEIYFEVHHFDVIFARDYYLIAQLRTHIPIVYVGDTTLHLMQDYLHLPSSYAILADQVEHAAIHRAAHLIYSSQWAAQDAQHHYKSSADKISIVPFGANLPLADLSTKLPAYGDCCHLLFVGKQWKNKGGDMVLSTFRVLQQRGFPCRLTIIGCSPQVNMPNVEVLGLLDKSQPEERALLVQKYREAHLFFMPSRFDCFGIVYAEASACGLPSIASAVGGVGEVVRNGVNGFCLPADAQPEDYADKIMAVFQNRSSYEALCRSAQAEAKRRFDWQLWGKEVQSILTQVVSASQQRQPETVKPQPPLPTYIINRKVRTERKAHILQEFAGRDEFDLRLVEACEHRNGAIGLWQSICKIVQQAQAEGREMILLCEDDHCFTAHYSKDYFFTQLLAAQRQGAELVNGGIGGFGTAVPVALHRSWVDWFWSTQFVVVFAPLFSRILAYDFQENDTADGVLSQLTHHKMALYPFVSTQQSFDYSDISESNHTHPDRIEAYFQKASQRLRQIHSVQQYYTL